MTRVLFSEDFLNARCCFPDLALRQQQRIEDNERKRKIILATGIAAVVVIVFYMIFLIGIHKKFKFLTKTVIYITRGSDSSKDYSLLVESY